MNYKFSRPYHKTCFDEEGNFFFDGVAISITFYKNKIKYRNGVIKKLVNEKEDVKLLKAALRKWVIKKRKEKDGGQ